MRKGTDHPHLICCGLEFVNKVGGGIREEKVEEAAGADRVKADGADRVCTECQDVGS